MRVLHLAATLLLVAACAASTRPPLLLSGAGPTYPPVARARGVSGEVTVTYDVTESGEVVNARVVAAEPPGVFDEAALTTVSSWRFKPQLIDGVATYARDVTSRVQFVPNGSDKYDRYRPPPE